MNDELRLEVTGGVALITLDRPAVHNAINPAIIAGLGAAYRRCDEDDAVRAVSGHGCRQGLLCRRRYDWRRCHL